MFGAPSFKLTDMNNKTNKPLDKTFYYAFEYIHQKELTVHFVLNKE